MVIVATGKKCKREITIKVTKDDEGMVLYDVSGCDPKYNEAYIDLLKDELQKKPIYAERYTPKDDEEDVNILNVLQNSYFDELKEITANDIKPVSFEEGAVY